MDRKDQVPIPVNHAVKALTQEIVDALKFLSREGYIGCDLSPKSAQILESWAEIRKKPKAETLEDIRKDLGDCRRCKLCKSRTHIVFGEGNPSARLVFVGEGPGYDEDIQGKPFVGKAGQLLNKIIKAMNLTREQVYICNIIKCRPPQNRNPEPDEIKACLPFLKRQVSAVSPEFICALGSVAIRALLDQEIFISRVRGKFFEFKGIKVMPTYHPAYLLRNPNKKRDVWEDVQKIMKEIGLS